MWARGLRSNRSRAVGEKIKPLIVKKPVLSEVPREIGEVTWVKPELVCTVKFTSWTKDDRLRAPVFLGLRAEVAPEEVVRETGLIGGRNRAGVARAKHCCPLIRLRSLSILTAIG